MIQHLSAVALAAVLAAAARAGELKQAPNSSVAPAAGAPAADPLGAVSAAVSAQVEAAGSPSAGREASSFAGESMSMILQGGSAPAPAATVLAPAQSQASASDLPGLSPAAARHGTAPASPASASSPRPSSPSRNPAAKKDWHETAAAILVLAAVAAFYAWAIVSLSRQAVELDRGLRQTQDALDRMP